MYRQLDKLAKEKDVSSIIGMMSDMGCIGLYNHLTLYTNRDYIWVIDPIVEMLIERGYNPNMTQVAKTATVYNARRAVSHIVDKYRVNPDIIASVAMRHNHRGILLDMLNR